MKEKFYSGHYQINCLVPLMDIYCKQSENPKEAAAKKILLAVQQCPSKVEASFKLGRMNELVKPFLSVLNTALHLLLDLKVGNFSLLSAQRQQIHVC